MEPSGSTTIEILIVGAGVIGSSVAYHLARLGASNIRVIDFDLEGSLSSTELNAGGVRATWNQPVNVELSKTSIEFFSQVADEVGYNPCGYLWLKNEGAMPSVLRALDRQKAAGWPGEVWDIAELRTRIPFLDKTDGLAGAIFSPRDGLINSNLLKSYFRRHAMALGVVFEDRIWIEGAEYSSSAQSISIKGRRYPARISEDERQSVLNFRGSHSSHPSITYHAKCLVNCAGAWANVLAELLEYPCPSYAVRRQVSIFDCQAVDLSKYGMIVDTSGVYFHPEGGHGLAGFANPDEPHGINYVYDGDVFFMEKIWSALYERSTAFERLKHITGWAGQYETSPDDSAILGEVCVGAPCRPGFRGRVFEAHSFSGHGVMQSYSAGLALAEKIIYGQYRTIDTSQLNGQRFECNQLLPETIII